MTFYGARRLSTIVVAQSQNPRVIPVAEAKVYVNPTRYMLANLQREIARDHFFYARGLMIGDDCYLWVSDLATHSDVVKELGLAGKVTGIVEFPSIYLTKWGDAKSVIEKAKHWTFGPGEDGRARIIGGMNVKGADLRSDIIARGAPAVRYQGRVYPGRRGEYHALICEQNNLPGKSEVERGYVIGGKFIPDDSLPQGIDSSELMSPMQKMRVDQDLVRDWRSR
jgi:hypothetical protein